MPAILNKNPNTKGSGMVLGTPYDSGNIVVQNKPGGYAEKLVNGTQQSATLAMQCDSTAGQPGNYLECTGENRTNEEGSGYIPVTALSYVSGTGILTVTVTNTFTVGQNVQFNGFLAGGVAINRKNSAILTAASASMITVKIETGLTISTDTGFVQYVNQTLGAGLSIKPSN